jgi:zinc protease
MKKIFKNLIYILIILAFSANLFAVEFSKELFDKLAGAKNKIPTIEIPEYERVQLDNGMVFYISKDTTLPIVEIKGYIKFGKMNETIETAGYSSVMLDIMNTATKKFSETELIDFKELNGLEISFSANNDYYTISANSLSEDLEALFEALASELIEPQFEGSHFERIVKEYLQSIGQSYTTEDGLLNMYYSINIFGKDHPYSFSDNLELLYANISSLTPEKLRNFYYKTISPNRIIISIAGNFEIDNVKELIRKYFAKWENTASSKPLFVYDSSLKTTSKIVIVDRQDSTQAKIKMGYRFPNFEFFKDKLYDRVAFLMANRIYGSGAFKSRLMKVLRTEKGYVYGINSSFSTGSYLGNFYVTTTVRYDALADLIKDVKKIMEDIKYYKEPLTSEELFNEVNLYNALFPNAYKDKITVLDSVAFDVEIRKINENYINEFIKMYNSLSAEDVQKAFSRFTYPNNFVTIIVGNKEKIIENLENNGIKDYEVIENK